MKQLIELALRFFIIKLVFLRVSGVYKFSTVKVKVYASPIREQYELINGKMVKSPVVVKYDEHGKVDTATICINTASNFCSTIQETEIFIMDIARRLDEEIFCLSQVA